MPAFVGPLLAFAMGVALSWLSRERATRPDQLVSNGALIVVGLFGALVVAPACAYFLLFASDWSFAYLVDGHAMPSAVSLLVAFADAAFVPAGFLSGAWASRRNASRALVALAAGPAAVAMVATLALLSRLRIEGTFNQVRNDFGTRPVAGGPLGCAILWMGAALVAGFVVTLRSLTDTDRPLPAPPREGEPDARPYQLGRRRR